MPLDAPLRLSPDTLIDIGDLLQAERFELIGDHVTFESLTGTAGRSWSGRLGDELVADGNGFFRIVCAERWTPLDSWADAPFAGTGPAA